MTCQDYTAHRGRLAPLLPCMFEIIAENMREIAPTGNSLEQDRALWHSTMRRELRRPDKHWVLAFSGETLAGYTLYRISGRVLHMDEIQVAKPFQGGGEAFPLLMGHMLHQAQAGGVRTVRASANKVNRKSQGILSAMGLKAVGETARSLRYQGDAQDALDWFRQITENNTAGEEQA